MKVSIQLDRWRPTRDQVGRLIDVFIASDPTAGAAAMRTMTATTPPGNEWRFDTYAEFDSELEAGDFTAFYLSIGDPPVSMTLSYFGSWTSFEATLPNRSALEGLVAVVRATAAG